jgi:glycosyltransferase involved in cell wall biosynthesis
VVSVIIPNYNHSAYLKERIDSVIEQTYQNLEIIILDDCSTDNSRDIIEQYRPHPKVTHINFNEKNSGSPFKQWEKGFKLARGEYIWIAESDDSARDIFLESLVTEMDKNKSASFAFCQAEVIDENNIIKGLGWGDINENEGSVIIHNGKDFLRKHLLSICSVYNVSKVIFRVSSYRKISDSYLKYKTCGDWAFWIELSTIGEVIDIRIPLSFFRWHNGSATSQSIKSGLNYVEAADIYEEAFKIRDLTLYYKTTALIYFLSFFYFDKNKKEKFLNYFKKLKGVYHLARFILILQNAKLKVKKKLKSILRYTLHLLNQ